jgi:hypothetical protein
VVTLLLVAPSAHATTVNFSYLDAMANPVATGQFSYVTGSIGVLGYSDLTAFSVNTGFSTYTLADVAGFTDYLWFAYDTAANVFNINNNLCGFSGCGYIGSLGATNSTGTSGFFFNAAPGDFADYRNFNPVHFESIELTPVGAPDAGSSLLLLGMSLAGLRAWRKR